MSAFRKEKNITMLKIFLDFPLDIQLIVLGHTFEKKLLARQVCVTYGLEPASYNDFYSQETIPYRDEEIKEYYVNWSFLIPLLIINDNKLTTWILNRFTITETILSGLTEFYELPHNQSNVEWFPPTLAKSIDIYINKMHMTLSYAC